MEEAVGEKRAFSKNKRVVCMCPVLVLTEILMSLPPNISGQLMLVFSSPCVCHGLRCLGAIEKEEKVKKKQWKLYKPTLFLFRN